MAETHRVDLGDGTSLYVEELGKGHGRAVVFGHSLLCDGRMFMDQVTDLAQDHHVINIDFRGHGRSDAPRRDYTIVDQGRDYGRVMDALGVDAAVIVGLSMGGMAALHFALERPERVSGLVLIDTSAEHERAFKRVKYAALARAARLLGMRRWLARQGADVLFGATFRSEQPEVVETWEDRIMQLDPRAAARAVKMVAGRPSVRARLGEIRVPALVIVGDEDTATPPPNARVLAEGLPSARLEVLALTGHLSTSEKPAETTRLIRGFCSGF